MFHHRAVSMSMKLCHQSLKLFYKYFGSVRRYYHQISPAVSVHPSTFPPSLLQLWTSAQITSVPPEDELKHAPEGPAVQETEDPC